MNETRRKLICNAISKLNSCADDLTNVKEDEDESRENIPENLQGGDAYSLSEVASDKLDDAISDIQQAITTLEEI